MIYLFSKFRFAKVRLSKIQKRIIRKIKLEKMEKAGIGKGMGSRLRRAIEKMDQMALDEISSSSDESSSSDFIYLIPFFSIFSNLLSLIFLFCSFDILTLGNFRDEIIYLIEKSILLNKFSSFFSKFIIQRLYVVSPHIVIDGLTGYPVIKNVIKNDKKILEEKILEEKR